MSLKDKNQHLRIGYIMQNGAPDLGEVSGPQLHTLAVINGLKKLGHSIRVFAYQKGLLGWTDDLKGWSAPKYGWTRFGLFRLLESGIRWIQTVFHLPYFGFFESLHFADSCRIHLEGCDVLYERHGYLGYGGVFAARAMRIPLILELNGNIVKEIDKRDLNMSRVQRWLGRWITSRTFHAAERIIVVSESLKKVLEKEFLIPPEKIEVILNGVDFELFSMNRDTTSDRYRFGLNGEHLVTFVGSFEPWHGVDLLVKAFQKVVRRIPDSKLILVGDGQQKALTVQEIKCLDLEDRVLFLGRLPQEQVASILGITKVVVAPYPFEHSDIVGSPLKIVEYMASGKGIVASTAPIHEVIEDGVTGLRVPPADADALAEGIVTLIENDSLRNRLGKNARERARQFSWDSVVNRLNEVIYDEVARKMKSMRDRRGIVAS